jgi:hypothetical protein
MYSIKNTNDSFRKHLTSYSRIFKKVCAEAKQIFFRSKIEKSGNPLRTMWDIIKLETGRQPDDRNNEIEMKNDKNKITNLELANKFNKYFVEIAKLLTNEKFTKNNEALKYLSVSKKIYPNRFKFKKLGKDEIIKITKAIKTKTSQDLWHMSTKLLKMIISDIADHLAILFNNCLKSGTFPDLLKMARIIPIFKKGEISDLNNYRPISVLPVISKILEKVVAEQLVHFLTSNHILHPQQFGFQKGKGTRDGIASLVEYILKSFEEGYDTYAVFCDLSKAFDCVDHGILISKLDHYGVRDEEKKFFTSYLSMRKQCTEINNVRSDTEIIEYGVPQGSILGPILFLLYVNDLPHLSQQNNSIIMFADDTSLLFKDGGASSAIEMEKVLDSVTGWFDDNNLVLNKTKTNVIHFSLRKENSQNEINNMLAQKSIEKTTQCKFLGVTLDGKLQWGSHIERLCNNLSKAIYAIRKTNEICGRVAARSIYFAYFHSLMTYGAIFWGRAADSSRVFILQKRAVRAILSMHPRESCRDKFKALGILTLAGVFIWECLLYARKNLANTPENGDVHSHFTRNRHNIKPVGHRLTKTSNSFVCLSVKLFNLLPTGIRNLSDTEYEREVKTYLLDKSFYSVNDMLHEAKSSV